VKYYREDSEGREDLENLRAPIYFVVLIHPRYAPLQFVKLDQRLDRAELIDVELFSARPATILRRRLASIFLNSQANYCVDKGRVTYYIPRCS